MCSANQFALFWLVDGEEEVSNSIQSRGITSITTLRSGEAAITTLFIEASARNNNSVIQCGVFVNSDEFLSEPVELYVQGNCTADWHNSTVGNPVELANTIMPNYLTYSSFIACRW